GQCARIIGDKMASLGLAVEYFDYPGVCTHVLGKKAGKGTKNVMISGHTDTVFLTGTTKERPFKTADGMAYGPGVADMKGGIAMALFVLEAMYEQGWNDKGMSLFFCGDEETGHPKSDAPAIYAREGAGKAAVFCLEPGRPGGEVVIGRKGVIIPEMRITGVAAHAMEPHKGASAVHEMARIITEITSLQDVERGILCNVGIASGGTGASVVAEHATLRFSIRFNKISEGEAILHALRRMAASPHTKGATIELLDDRFLYQPFETTDKVENLLEFVRQQGRKVGIAEIGAVFQAGGSDACWTANAGSPTLCGMGPVGGFFHNEREYISLDGLLQRAKLLAACINNI
ncbi:MAG TPA: M20/M25/M40 family metallo-hydrolase, partial [Negativicutes bacterium]|nr:M20/M25/M40 family metallo-hydrolase [Negativicutes bacterium]